MFINRYNSIYRIVDNSNYVTLLRGRVFVEHHVLFLYDCVHRSCYDF